MVTVEEARKILGEKSKNLSDQEIESVVNFLYEVCERSIDMAIKSRLEKNRSTSLRFKNRAI